MSILENVSSAIEPSDIRHVRAAALAIIEWQGFQCSPETVDLVIRDVSRRRRVSRHGSRIEGAVQLAAVIINYLHEELDDDQEGNQELLRALKAEVRLS